jgi:hypothetical protein
MHAMNDNKLIIKAISCDWKMFMKLTPGLVYEVAALAVSPAAAAILIIAANVTIVVSAAVVVEMVAGGTVATASAAVAVSDSKSSAEAVFLVMCDPSMNNL